MTTPIEWKLTKDQYPTPAQLDDPWRIVVASPLQGAPGYWQVRTLCSNNFSTCNCGSTPMYWAFADELLPEEPKQ